MADEARQGPPVFGTALAVKHGGSQKSMRLAILSA